MKKLLGLLVFFLLLSSAAHCKTIYLIRHAEKVDDGSKNPMLTDQGQQRAENIADMLSQAGITQVYATDYHRTQMTAKPMANLLGLEVTSYDPRELSTFAAELKGQDDNVLVVGHSNTTPTLARLISGKQVIDLAETDFDYIFQVVIEGNQTTLNILKSLSSNSAE